MSTVSCLFTVEPVPDAVVPYLADFAHAERCVREYSGRVRVGSSWHTTSKIAGVSTELTYTLERLGADQVVLVGRNDTATSTVMIEVVSNGAGSRVTYTNELEFPEVAKLATPLAKVVVEKPGNDTEQHWTTVLDGLAVR